MKLILTLLFLAVCNLGAIGLAHWLFGIKTFAGLIAFLVFLVLFVGIGVKIVNPKEKLSN